MMSEILASNAGPVEACGIVNTHSERNRNNMGNDIIKKSTALPPALTTALMAVGNQLRRSLPPVSVPGLFQLFTLAAGILPFLFGGIPPPQSWCFELGDTVCLLAKSPEDRLRLLSSLLVTGVTGKICVLYPASCEVDFDGSTFLVPTIILRKVFEFLDSVLTPSNRSGMVLASSGAPDFWVKVLVDATDVQFHPNELQYAPTTPPSVQPVSSLSASANAYATISLEQGPTAVWVGVVGSLVSLNINGEIVVMELEELHCLVALGMILPVDTAPASAQLNSLRTSRAPWLELPVIVTGWHALKGYHGRVKDVRGTVQVQDQWVDFDDLRQQSNLCFLHEAQHVTDTHFGFKPGYDSTYSGHELQRFSDCQQLAFAAEVNRIREVAESAAREEAKQRVEWEGPAFPEPHWLAQTAFADVFQGLQVFVQVKTGPYASNVDLPLLLVHLQGPEPSLPGFVQFYYQKNRKAQATGEQVRIQPSDVAALDSVYTKELPISAEKSRGLYLVFRGEHAVHITQDGMKFKEVHSLEPHFHVHRENLLVVDYPWGPNKKGNEALEHIHAGYGHKIDNSTLSSGRIAKSYRMTRNSKKKPTNALAVRNNRARGAPIDHENLSDVVLHDQKRVENKEQEAAEEDADPEADEEDADALANQEAAGEDSDEEQSEPEESASCAVTSVKKKAAVADASNEDGSSEVYNIYLALLVFNQVNRLQALLALLQFFLVPQCLLFPLPPPLQPRKPRSDLLSRQLQNVEGRLIMPPQAASPPQAVTPPRAVASPVPAPSPDSVPTGNFSDVGAACEAHQKLYLTHLAADNLLYKNAKSLHWEWAAVMLDEHEAATIQEADLHANFVSSDVEPLLVVLAYNKDYYAELRKDFRLMLHLIINTTNTHNSFKARLGALPKLGGLYNLAYAKDPYAAETVKVHIERHYHMGFRTPPGYSIAKQLKCGAVLCDVREYQVTTFRAILEGTSYPKVPPSMVAWTAYKWPVDTPLSGSGLCTLKGNKRARALNRTQLIQWIGIALSVNILC
ncbi:hypothetical protein BDP27DRAFT_1410162 [Rhodocollybia butyracea]|uniref:Uncharacterized protein n=1 Tax=Rhodocollybia butyracea TaxID=206335 RepID=A0A9P5P6Z3_9AGAR|nr:hypothetical protein BDP27DRAFT_1410162 [Rhodocollybia butyracea]